MNCGRNSKKFRIGKRLINVDGCLPILLKVLNENKQRTTLASCCGHGKYHPSIVVKLPGFQYPLEIFSGEFILRKSRFYIKDTNGFYFIPEALSHMGLKKGKQ